MKKLMTPTVIKCQCFKQKTSYKPINKEKNR